MCRPHPARASPGRPTARAGATAREGATTLDDARDGDRGRGDVSHAVSSGVRARAGRRRRGVRGERARVEGAARAREDDDGNAAETLESWRKFNARYAAHMAAEDEVLFPTVASRIENVAYAYEFEHEAEEWLFEEVTACLEAAEAKDDSKRREFGGKAARIVHATRTTLKAHLAKESEHVLPMLEARFRSDEQAELVWRLGGSFRPRRRVICSRGRRRAAMRA